jgi:S1-C subfamily serine protease
LMMFAPARGIRLLSAALACQMLLGCSLPTLDQQPDGQTADRPRATREQGDSQDPERQAQRRAEYFRRNLNRISQNIVMIRAEVAGTVTRGAGIIFSRRRDAVLIVTANHVVRRGTAEPTDVTVTLKTLPDAMIKARLLARFDRERDVAVLEVRDLRERGIDPCKLEMDVLAERGLNRGHGVYPLGNPNGVRWGMPVTPDHIAEVREAQITFQSAFISSGHSGGALLDEEGLVVE